MSLKYEPASEPLHIYVQELFSDRELYRSEQVESEFRKHARGAPPRVHPPTTPYKGPSLIRKRLPLGDIKYVCVRERERGAPPRVRERGRERERGN